MTPNDTEIAVPEWANDVDPAIVARAIKDHSFLRGLWVKTNCVDVSPDGIQELDKFVRVKIGKIAYLQNSSSDYVDCFWEVAIHPDDLKLFDTKGELDPCILGIVYELEDGVVEDYYPGFYTDRRLREELSIRVFDRRED